MYGALSVLALAGLASCASSSKTAATSSSTSTPSSSGNSIANVPTGDEKLSKEELEELFYARKESELKNFSQADVDFVVGMIGHHAQALVMSELAPENGASTSVQILASRIINAQKDEIATMQQWLADRDQPVPQIHIEGLILTIHGGDHNHMQHMDHTNMPGMLSQVQLNELGEAKGAEFDRLYLTYMIDHHSGAVVMVEDLFSKDGAGQGDAIFKLASDIQVDQRTEIARMQRMLDRMATKL